ncbi:MAG: MopE-related protein [Myxococcota bacterium]
MSIPFMAARYILTIIAVGAAWGALGCGDDADGSSSGVIPDMGPGDAGGGDAGVPDMPMAMDEGMPDLGSPDLGSPDLGSPDAGPAPCFRDADCDDGLFCTGIERCRPGEPGTDPFGCLPATNPCIADQICDEGMDACITDCAAVGDADGDGVDSVFCGGLDCADEDPDRFPGNTEVCDADDHDEDCDPSTVGDRDADGDGEVPAFCCNAVPGMTTVCGLDCNDAVRSINSRASEVCEGLDNDCDGTIDEGVRVAGFEDRDGDGRGDGTRTVMACAGSRRFSVFGDDCDDANRRVSPVFAEICDGIDNDCNGIADEFTVEVPWYVDGDGDGFGIANAASPPVLSCDPVPDRVVLSGDCDDTDGSVSPVALERCNGLDDDCNGRADFVISPGDTEDDDRDRVPDARCAAALTDCDDVDPFSGEGFAEICDFRDNDCDASVDEMAGDVGWFPDADDDGFGDDTSRVVSCDIVPGRLPRGGDCDDGDDEVNPLGFDGCLGRPRVDDDCDGTVDETFDEVSTYEDLDGDGVGAGAALLSCAGSLGRASLFGDCAPRDASIFPGAPEDCADDIDQDCDGLVDCDDADCDTAPVCARTSAGTVAMGSSQSAETAVFYGSDVVVRVTDLMGMPLSGMALDLEPGPYEAAVSPVTTDSVGLARFTLRAAAWPGTRDAVFTAMGLRPLFVPLTSTPPMPGIVSTIMNAAKSSTTARTVPVAAPAFRPGVAPGDVEVGSDGTTYVIVDDAVYAIDDDGILDLFAGGGTTLGDGGDRRAANLGTPRGLFVDEAGDRLLVAANSRVRAIDLTTGIVSTIAGGASVGGPGFGDGSAATAAELSEAEDVAVTSDGRVWIIDDGAKRAIRVVETTGIINTVVPQGLTSNLGITVCGSDRCSLAIDDEGDVLASGRIIGPFASSATPGILRIDATTDEVTRVLGLPAAGVGEGVSALAFGPPSVGDVAVTDEGLILFSSSDHRVRQIDPGTGLVTTFVGTGTAGSGGDGGAAGSAQLNAPDGLAIHPGGHLLIADGGNRALRRVWGPLPTPGLAPTVAAVGSTMLPPRAAGAAVPGGLTVEVTTDTMPPVPLAGLGVEWEVASGAGFIDAATSPTSASGLSVATAFTGLQAGPVTFRARVFDASAVELPDSPIDFLVTATLPPAGNVSTVVNLTRSSGSTGIPGAASTARITTPQGVAAASDGTFWVAAVNNHQVYEVSPAGAIRLVAGTGVRGSTGDLGPAALATLAEPRALCYDEASDYLYVLTGAIANAGRLRRIDLGTADERIRTVVGGGSATAPSYGDGGPGTLASFSSNGQDCEVDSTGRVIFVDGTRIRTYEPTTDVVDLLFDASSTGTTPTDFLGCSSPRCYIALDSMDRVHVKGTFFGAAFNAPSSSTWGIARYDAAANQLVAVLGNRSGSAADGATIVNTLLQSGGDFVIRADGSICFNERFTTSSTRGTLRCTDPVAGTTSTVLGIAGSVGSTGEQVPGTMARLSDQVGQVIEWQGHLMVADGSSNIMRVLWQ